MVIQLYSEKSPDSGAQIGLIQNLVSRGLVEGQFTPKNVKVEFVKADQAGEKFKDAVKKAKNAQYLDDAEIVLVFQSPKKAPTPETPENPAPEKEAPEGDGGEETVSESVKVQDLSKQVGLKSVGTKCACGKKKSCCSGKKTVKEDEAPKKKAPPKKVKSKKDLEKKAPEKDAPEKDAPVSEAEMEATGEELKAKIVDLVKRVLYVPDGEEVEMVTLEDFREGYDTFFTKLSFKE